jgi:beta-glucanase (GH16 family)
MRAQSIAGNASVLGFALCVGCTAPAPGRPFPSSASLGGESNAARDAGSSTEQADGRTGGASPQNGSQPGGAGGDSGSSARGGSAASGASGATADAGLGSAVPGNGVNGPAQSDAASPLLSGWTLSWSDEFEGDDGSAVDASKWNHDTGGSGWGNQELEYYTADSANAQQIGGNLVITAKTEGASEHSCWNGACQYTSARLLTSGKYSAAYGRVEARVKMPAGKGLWPAFWMLGDNIGSVGWPTCGEIDIMETVGSDITTNHGSMHGPGYSGGSPLTATIQLPGNVKLSDDFHIYAVEWAPDVVRFYVDAILYETRTPADIPPGTEWVYNHPFFLLLNVAVGGTWPGSPDASAHFPAQMSVDYVRVYTAN